MLSSSPSKIHEPRVTGVSPRPTDQRQRQKLRNTSDQYADDHERAEQLVRRHEYDLTTEEQAADEAALDFDASEPSP